MAQSTMTPPTVHAEQQGRTARWHHCSCSCAPVRRYCAYIDASTTCQAASADMTSKAHTDSTTTSWNFQARARGSSGPQWCGERGASTSHSCMASCRHPHQHTYCLAHFAATVQFKLGFKVKAQVRGGLPQCAAPIVVKAQPGVTGVCRQASTCSRTTCLAGLTKLHQRHTTHRSLALS